MAHRFFAPWQNIFRSHDSFELEIIKSEYKRTQLMLIALVTLSLLSALDFARVRDTITSFLGSGTVFYSISGWLFLMAFFEMLILLRIRWFMKRGLRLPTSFKYLYSFIEISMPSAMMFYLLETYRHPWFLDSPLFAFYFVAIILSALHLDGKISAFIAIVASAEYALIIYHSFHNLGGAEAPAPEAAYYVRCALVLLAGVFAAFVAEEIKRRVTSQLAITQHKMEIERTFGQQVSSQIAAVLQEQGNQARQLEVTVLALDIRNFSSFAESHSPDEILAFQNKFFGPIMHIIHDHQGVVNQIMGDGLMATFGAPLPSVDHATQALLAASEILTAVHALGDEQGRYPSRLGMGLHSGDVVTGNIGNETRKQYSISGNTVVIAFRIEQLNKEFNSQLLITETVKNKLPGLELPMQYLGVRDLKGLQQGIGVYRVR